jgi:hypothetical protein
MQIRRIASCTVFVVAVTLSAIWTLLPSPPSHTTGSQQRKIHPRSTSSAHLRVQTEAHLPLSFEENRGQIDPRVKFLSRGPDSGLFLTATEATIVHRATRQLDDLGHGMDVTAALAAMTRSAVNATSIVRLSWAGADPNAQARGTGRQRGITNYLLGNDKSKWVRRVPRYDGVELHNSYPGIDLVYHGNSDRLEFDYRVAPHIDPRSIQVAIDGPSLVEVDTSGALKITVAGDEFTLLKPVAYQEKNGRRSEVEVSFSLTESHRFGFRVGAYDTSLPLIIDPVLQFAANFGGGFQTVPADIAVDPSGDIYMTGTTCATDYPVTSGALKAAGGSDVANICNDVVVTKLDPTASTLLYSTYLGGVTGVDFSSRLLLDSSGEVIVAGTTTSTDFPTTSGAYQKTAKAGTCDYGPFIKGQACSDGFLSKLSADGSSLIFSTLLGGERADLLLALTRDKNGNFYVAGATDSTLFPTVGTPYSSTYGGGTCQATQAPCFDAFISELSADGSQLLASTYFGGNDDEFAASIALDATGNVIIAGSTDSSNFPATVMLGTKTPHPGQDDLFVAKLDPTLSTLTYATEIGGSGDDVGVAMKVDSTGAVYLTGTTGSTDFPVTTGSYQTAYAGPASPTCPRTLDSSLINGQPTCGDVFLIKLKPDGSGLTFATYLGGQSPEMAFNLALDSALNVWLVGGSSSMNFPFTTDAYFTSANSLFLSEISADGKNLLFSTALSKTQVSQDLGTAIFIDASNNVFVGGESSQVLATPGAYTTSASPGTFLMKFSPGTAQPGLQLSATSLSFIPPAYVTAVNASSPPQSVTLTNNGTGTLHLAISELSGSQSGGAAPFAESDNCGSSVVAGGTCTISAIFQPTTAGANQGGNIQIVSDAPNAPQSISVDGSSGIIESASFLPAALNFPGQAPGTTSATQMSFLNSSATDANSFFVRPTASPVIGGANASDFQIDTSGCSVAANGCSLTVAFKPTGATPVNRSATVTVPTQAANSPEVLTLNGGVSTTPVISASGIFLNPTVVGQTFNGSFAITNTGGATLNVTGVSVTGANASDFTVQSNINCGAFPFNLASQGLCALNVAFKPSAPGNRTATLTFADNETTPTSITVTGLGVTAGGPEISLVTTPNPINGVISYPDTVIGHITNFNIAIIAPLNLGSGASSSVHVTEALSGDFVLAPTPNTTCTLPTVLLAGGASCNYVVIFAPTAVGPRTGTLTLTTDAPGTPSFTVNFSANGVTIPVAALAPATINFGPVVSGTVSSAQTVMLTNSGGGPLTFTAPVLTGPFSVSASTCASPLAAAASCVISVKFSPPAKGPASGTLTLTTNAASQTLAAGLQGTGVTGAFASVSPASLTFGSQAVNTVSPPKQVTLTNAGDTTFNIAGIHASENFSVASNTCGATLAPSTSCTINVSFAPGADTFPMFSSNGQLFITTNAPGSPQAVPLSGTTAASTGAATVISVVSSVNPSTVNQSVTFTATVTSQTSGTITGTVTFLDGGTSIGTGVLAAGKATFATTGLTAGNHSITASYPGDANFAPSNSSGLPQVVNAGTLAASSTDLTSAPNPSTVGQSVIFTATVTSSTAGTISGTVNFLDGTKSIGSGIIASGVVTVSTPALTAGTHSVTAQYVGDSTFAASTSGAVSQVVNAAVSGDFGITTAPTTLSLPAGQAGTSTITIAPLQGFNSTVSLSCGSLPAKVTCAISPASVTLDGTNPKTAAVMIGTVANSALPPPPLSPNQPRFPFGMFVSVVLALLLLATAKRRENMSPDRVLLVTAILILALGLGSCSGGSGSSGSTGTIPGTYPITLTGTGPSGAPSHATTLTLTVTK